jgi:hypothetical protein
MAQDDLQRVIDVLEIQRMKAAYCEIVDRSVADPSLTSGLEALLAEDCTSEYGFGSIAGRDQIIRFGAESAASVDMFWHAVATPRIEVEGDRALASWTVMARSRRKGAAEPATVYGRYVDTLRRTPAGWRFTAMNFEILGDPEPWTPGGSN